MKQYTAIPRQAVPECVRCFGTLCILFVRRGPGALSFYFLRSRCPKEEEKRKALPALRREKNLKEKLIQKEIKAGSSRRPTEREHVAALARSDRRCSHLSGTEAPPLGCPLGPAGHALRFVELGRERVEVVGDVEVAGRQSHAT